MSGKFKPLQISFNDDEKQIIKELGIKNINVYPFNMPEKIFDDMEDKEIDIQEKHCRDGDDDCFEHDNDCLLCAKYRINKYGCWQDINKTHRLLQDYANTINYYDCRLYDANCDKKACYNILRNIRNDAIIIIKKLLNLYKSAQEEHQIFMDIYAKSN